MIIFQITVIATHIMQSTEARYRSLLDWLVFSCIRGLGRLRPGHPHDPPVLNHTPPFGSAPGKELLVRDMALFPNPNTNLELATGVQP